MNIIVIVAVGVIALAAGRAVVEVILNGSKKRARLVFYVGTVMTISWLFMGLMSGASPDPDDGILKLVVAMTALVAFTGSVASTLAMVGLIVTSRKSLPGRD